MAAEATSCPAASRLPTPKRTNVPELIQTEAALPPPSFILALIARRRIRRALGPAEPPVGADSSSLPLCGGSSQAVLPQGWPRAWSPETLFPKQRQGKDTVSSRACVSPPCPFPPFLVFSPHLPQPCQAWESIGGGHGVWFLFLSVQTPVMTLGPSPT